MSDAIHRQPRSSISKIAGCIYLAACCGTGLAQTPAVTTLQIDVANQVSYVQDVADPLKYASDANAIQSLGSRTFSTLVNLADIVAINGKPAKGVFVGRSIRLALTPNATAGQSIADVTHNNEAHWHFEMLQEDGTQIGSLMAIGLASGDPPPGAPANSIQHNMAIVGGTGAFLGSRGQAGQAAQPFTRPAAPGPQLSITVDPSNRRKQTGGNLGFIVQFIPAFTPQVVITPNGPAVFHSDLSPVNAESPARTGETLILQATGLGPTRPGVDPGTPFSADSPQRANSPVEAAVDGKTVAVTSAQGWPGLADTYQVSFVMPEPAAPGTAAIQLTAAWVTSSRITIPVQ